MILLMQIFTPMTYGIAFIFAGVIIRLIIGRNRFKRRVGYKAYKYPNYAASEIIPVLERLFNLAALALIVLGIVFCIWG
ncbi:hypothetical protein [Sphingobacterium sp.]|uniref:hypothetical protein n=1 Tax=Sphingobacterium sp. TaxID=341027 RepID=UPI0031D372AB